jgi:energy-coupling factor transporter ATP-binding protein EcfA2
MDNPPNTQSIHPFESASELHDSHERLLELLDERLGQGSSVEAETEALKTLEPQIRQFVERGVATGAYIEEVPLRTSCQTLVDYWASSLARAGINIERVRLAAFNSAQLPELPDEPCPYVGLETIREANADLFFGRDEAIGEVLKDLRISELVVVAGPSGSGKSSLVLGGVLPKLRNEGWAKNLRFVPPFVPGTALLEHLAANVRRGVGGGGSELAADADALRSDQGRLLALAGGGSAAPILIIIDQFEEVFTLSSKEDRDALLANVAFLLQNQSGSRVILTVRDEFERRVREQVWRLFQCKKVWYAIPEMDYDGLRDAIIRPALTINLQIKTEVVDHLVKRVIHQPGALPLLQFTLRSLWDVRDHNRITWERYRKIGGDPLVALANSAKAFLDDHKDPETFNEIKRLLLELVRVDERLEAYRQPVARSQLLAAGKANSKDVLKLLEDADFVRITPNLSGDDAVVEVKHESLVRNWPELVTWIGEKQVSYRRRLALTDAAERWSTSPNPDQELLTGSMLAEAAQQPNLSDLEKKYVRASEDAADRERTKLRELNEKLGRANEKLGSANKKLERRFTVAAGLIVVALGLVAGIVFLLNSAMQSRDQLKRQRDQIESQLTQLDVKNKRIEDQIELLGQQNQKIEDQNAQLARNGKKIEDQKNEIADDERSILEMYSLEASAPPDLKLLLNLEIIRFAQKAGLSQKE